MSTIRCTAKLLKRLHQPAKPTEPPPADNLLGEWYADIEVHRGTPWAILLNASTGIVLVLPARAADLRRLPELAAIQLANLIEFHGLGAPESAREVLAWTEGTTHYAATRDRSLLSSLNQRKFEAWMQFEHNDLPPIGVAARQWEGLFKHPSLPKNQRSRSDWHRPLDLLRAKVLPSAQIIDLSTRRPRTG